MSIKWFCDCGKSLKAPETSAGRKARCPACGVVNAIPELELAEEDESPSVPPPVPPVRVAKLAASDPMAVSDPDDFGEYELADDPGPQLPKPVGRSTMAAGIARTAAEAAAAASGVKAATPRTPRATSSSVVMDAPPYQPRPVVSIEEDADDDNDDDLPLGSGRRTWRDFVYFALLVAMVPLVIETTYRSGGPFATLARAVDDHPELEDKVSEAYASSHNALDIVNVFPGKRLDGALLARDSYGHWGIALVTAGLFFGLLMFTFEWRSATPQSLLGTAAFTATVGIVLLLAFQWVAIHTQGWWVRGTGIGVVIFYIVKFIGYSYIAADDPNNSFVKSFFAHTFGVGLCEEICKAIPLLVLMNNLSKRMSWRTACLWGMASGAGFGIAEGIMYAGRYYNGISGVDEYLVRFLSCVSLHVVLSGSVGITLFRFRAHFFGSEGTGSMLGTVAILAAPAMILHGLYDTLMKMDYEVGALAVALASFAYLALMIELSQVKGDGHGPGAETSARGYA